MSQIVKESFITNQGLPRETILCWFKFEKSAKFTSILLTYDDKYKAITDFEFRNILQPILVLGKGSKRNITITREHLSLDGFFGFTFKYENIPSGDESIPFAFDFVTDTQTIDHFVLETTIIRPLVMVVKEHTAKEPQRILLHNSGSAHAFNITLFANSSSKNIKTELKSIEHQKETYNFFKKQIRFRELVMDITGQGSGFIELMAKYNDETGNQYTTILDRTPITISAGQLVSVPISGPTNQLSLNDNNIKIKTN